MSLPATTLVAAFDAMPTQVAILDDVGVIRYTNRAWREFGTDNDLGDAADSIGENYLGVCDVAADEDEHAATAATGIRSVLAGDREQFSFEYPCHSPDERRWFSMQAFRFANDGETYVLVMHLNITERKLAELAVEDQNDQLEMVASIMSHDLRNPLNVALGYAEMLREETDGDRASEIVDALERMEAIIGDSLVLARQTDVEEREPVALATAARDAWKVVDHGDATLEVADGGTVEADPELLAHVFENLFRNAVQHGGEGVAVTVGTVEDGFYVADDGPGIPAEEREQIWETGFTTDRGDGGTGFGLSIVQAVVDAHGWAVGVTEAEAGGARFEITNADAN